MLLLYCIMAFVLDPSRSLLMSHDPMTVTVTCDVTLTPNPRFQNKIKEIEIEMRKELKIIRVYCF